MGVVIRGTGVARPSSWPFSHGARRVADAAARACLERAGADPHDVELLVNAGIYRERGLGEPALAALIQEDVHVNPGGQGFRTTRSDHGSFSFDIANGACGVLTAADIVRGFLLSDAIDLGMVVTSDSAPGPTRIRAMPYAEAGAALLLGRDDTVTGLSAVSLATYPEFAGLAEGFWAWHERSRRLPGRPRAGNRLTVRHRPGFVARAVDCAEDAATRFLADAAMPAAEIDLLVATPEPGFADALADRLGISHDRTFHVGERVGRMHTAQLIAAIDAATRLGRWQEARTCLLVSAGSGITVATALYEH